MAEADYKDERDHDTSFESPIAVKPKTGPVVLEIGAVDQELEDRQMDI